MSRSSRSVLRAALRLPLLLGALSPAAFASPPSEMKLLGSDSVASDWFGRRVAVSGGVALAGAHDHSHAGIASGAAYVYRLDGGAWSEEAELLPSDGQNMDYFGLGVGVRGDLALVGAPRNDALGADAGAAYIFRFDGSAWQAETKLLAGDGEAEDAFGYAVAVDGNVAVVGAYGDDDLGTDAGAVYVFRWGGTQWVEEQKLLAPDGIGGDGFGFDVSVSSGVVLVGQYRNVWPPTEGRAYAFRYDGAQWAADGILRALDGFAGELFGYSVSISGEVACVGAVQGDGASLDSGVAYLFRFDGTAWREEARISARDGQINDAFGYDVDVNGNLAVAGAWKDDDHGTESGSAYVFRNVGSTWVQTHKLTATDAAEADAFGIAVAAGDGVALVGAPQHDDAGENAGAAYLYGDLFSGESFSFVHLTDTHIDVSPLAHGASERLDAVLDRLRTEEPLPSFVVMSGDLVETGDGGLGANYNEFLTHFYASGGLLHLDAAATIPVYISPGNHDYRWSQNLLLYDQVLGYPNDDHHCYVQYPAGARLTSIDSGRDNLLSQVGDPALPEGTGFSQENLAWIDGVLGPGALNLVLLHHPVMNRKDGVWNDGCVSDRRSQFLALCAQRFVGLVLSGHTHDGDVYAYAGGNETEITGEFDSHPGEPHYYLAFDGSAQYDRTLNAQSPDTRTHTAYRRITVTDNMLQVFAYTYAMTTSSGELRWEEGPAALAGGDGRAEPARLHAYDGAENHLGIGAGGTLEFAIPGSFYAPWIGQTGDECGADASVPYDLQDYRFEIEGLAAGEADFRWSHQRGDSLGEIELFFRDLPVAPGSTAALFIQGGTIDESLLLDLNGDGAFEETRPPDEVRYRNAPAPPTAPQGAASGSIGQVSDYTAATQDPEGDRLWYQYDWGDGTRSAWLGPCASGDSCDVSHAWDDAGEYLVRARARDDLGYTSGWSDPLTVSIGSSGVGDAERIPGAAWRIPNPFTGADPISLRLTHAGRVRVGIHDLTGRRLAWLVDGELSAGSHTLRWPNSTAVGRGAGVYFLRRESEGLISTRKVILLR